MKKFRVAIRQEIENEYDIEALDENDAVEIAEQLVMGDDAEAVVTYRDFYVVDVEELKDE